MAIGRLLLSARPAARAGDRGEISIRRQLITGIERLAARARRTGRQMPAVLAYFQAHSSTHGPPERLAETYEQALCVPQVAGVIISTRPDCLDGPRWDVLRRVAGRIPMWLELGLQSAHDETLKAIGRGHDAACFDAAVLTARKHGLKVVAHVILGLPGEDIDHTNATARHLAELGVWGVKMHNLMILEQTALADQCWPGEALIRGLGKNGPGRRPLFWPACPAKC